MKSWNQVREERDFNKAVRNASDEELTEMNNEYRELRREARRRMEKIKDEREKRLKKDRPDDLGQTFTPGGT